MDIVLEYPNPLKEGIVGQFAEEAGLKEKDVVVGVNGETVKTTADLQEKISRYRPGDKIEVSYLRKGKNEKVNVILRNIDGGTGIVAAGSSTATVFGATVAPLSSAEKRQFNVDGGVKIESISEGRFRDLGLGRGTIIVSINGQKVNNASDIRKAGSGKEGLASLEGYTTDGTYFKYQTRR